MSDIIPDCLLDPSDPGYYDMPCHGYFTDICQCTFEDIFFEKAYIPTIFGTAASRFPAFSAARLFVSSLYLLGALLALHG